MKNITIEKKKKLNEKNIKNKKLTNEIEKKIKMKKNEQ